MDIITGINLVLDPCKVSGLCETDLHDQIEDLSDFPGVNLCPSHLHLSLHHYQKR